MQLEKRAQPAAVQLLDDFSFYKKEVISSSLLKDASPYLFPLDQHKGEFEFMKPKVTIKGLTCLTKALSLTPPLPARPDLCPGTESSWELRSMQGVCGTAETLHSLWARKSLVWQYLGPDSVCVLRSRKRDGDRPPHAFPGQTVRELVAPQKAEMQYYRHLSAYLPIAK